MTTVAEAMGLAHEHHLAGRMAEAAHIYRRVLEALPDQADALHLLGLTERAAGRKAAAIELIRRALVLNPGLGDAHYNLGNALRDQNELAEAAGSYRRALALNPDYGNARDNLIDVLIRQGLALGRQGRAEAARAHFDDVLAIKPAAADLYRLRAVSCYRERLFDATRDLLIAWLLKPEDRRTYQDLWTAFTKLGGEGIAFYQAILATEDDYVAWIALGNAQRSVHYGLTAERAYRQAIALHPELPFAYSRLGCLLATQHRFIEADRLFTPVAERFDGRDQVIRLDPAFLADLDAGRCRLAPLPVRTGDPRPTERAVMVLVSCDSAYLARFGYAMVHSVLRNSGLDAGIHIHIVNPDAAAHAEIAAIRRDFPEAELHVTTEDTDLSGCHDDERKTYYACARFLHLPELLRLYRRPVLLIDVDMIVLRDLRPLLDTVNRNDIGIVGGEQHPFEMWNTFWADVILINDTPAARRFFDRTALYIRFFLSAGKLRWFLDQMALYAVYFVGCGSDLPPRLTLFPKDIHRLAVNFDPAADSEAAEDGCFFWSMHASYPEAEAVVHLPRFQQYQRQPPSLSQPPSPSQPPSLSKP